MPGGAPQIVTPFECQLGKDPEKLYRYVEYMATARRDNRCPGGTVVFSPDPEVLAYIRHLFEREPHLCPVLIGRDAVPMVLTLDEAIARPELATFCAIVHASSDAGLELARQAMTSARYVEPHRGQANVRILLNCLTEDQMNELQKTPEYRDATQEFDNWTPGPWYRQTSAFTRGQREGLEQGQREGLLHALRVVLSSRGLIASDEQIAVIDGCTSVETLEHWITQASRVHSVAELLAA